MHLLKYVSVLAIFIVLSISCKNDGPVTPEQAFDELRKSYYNRDAAAIVNILSGGSVEKIRKIIIMISSMNEVQLKSLSERLGATADEMKKLSPQDYIRLQMSAGEKIGNDTMEEILKYKIVGIDIKNQRAVVRVENGMEIVFVKEGRYWKFDMDEM